MQEKNQYEEEIIKELEQEVDKIVINPTQDYKEGELIYTFFKGEQPYLIFSNKAIIKYRDASDFGYKLRNEDISFSYLSASTVLDYINGKTVSAFNCFERLTNYIKKFVVFQDPLIYVFISLWIIGTYMYRLFRFYPYIWINADKGSGKSRLMEVMSPLAFNSIMAINQTQATIFRSIDADGCTLFIDEFEKMSGDVQQGILTILNSGFNIDSGKTTRMERDGDTYRRKTFSKYSPKVLAGIHDINDVLQDRCIKIKMLKKSKSEEIERYKVDDNLRDYIVSLRNDLYILGLQNAKEIHRVYTSNSILFPKELSDRECDIWEVIFTIASFIDTNHNTSLQRQMKEMAVKASKERSLDDIDKNVSYKIINSLNDILPIIEPVKILDGINYYSSNSVYKKLIENDDFEWITTQKQLTAELKNRFSIYNKRFTLNSRKIRAYGISKEYLQELLERYNLLNIDEDEEIKG